MDLVVIVMSGIHSDDVRTANMTDEGAAAETFQRISILYTQSE